jgi:hypothetical protein
MTEDGGYLQKGSNDEAANHSEAFSNNFPVDFRMSDLDLLQPDDWPDTFNERP